MNIKTMEILEYNKIKDIVKSYALSEIAKGMIVEMEPYIDINIIERYMGETTEARAIIERSSSVPLHSLNGIKSVKEKLGKGLNLLPEELEQLCTFLRDGKKLKKFMTEKEDVAPRVSTYAFSICELQDVVDEIEGCIAQGRVIDKATSELSRIRKKIIVMQDKVKVKIDSILKNPKYRIYLQDNIVSMRNGRYVIPVKSQYKHELQGSIQDSSSSGSTVFIEPIEVKKVQDELNLLRIDEEKEVYKILSTLTALIGNYERELSINIETMAYYDFLFAKAKYSKEINGRSVSLNTNNNIVINNGRHPLLGNESVPLNFTIGEDYSALIITGPNTGGKTVALKTVGLLTMMVQSGLHVPVDEDSSFSVFIDVLADIGDGQSIEQSLSTFSSHLKNIISIIHCADPYTLVIMDEVGVGTDPGEGMGIATAVLEEVYSKKAIILATTHYSEIKEFAENTPGFKNGCMEFDINTLKPTYKLSIGKAGESNAFNIALRLGMDRKLVERAHLITYKEDKKYSGFNDDSIEEKLIDKKAVIAHEESIQKLKQVEKIRVISEKQKEEPKFNIGDAVYISTMDRTGIVYETENSKGDIGVMVMKSKFKINHKRLSLFIDSSELYPENYDFDIIFESKDDRKKDKVMNKRHVEGMEIEVSGSNKH